MKLINKNTLLGFFLLGMIMLNACREDLRDIKLEDDNRKGLDLNFTFVNKPEPGTTLIANLYYAEQENEPFYGKNPDKVLKHPLSVQDIEQGLTLTFEGLVPTPFAYVIAFADLDASGELSEGDIAVAYLAQSVREVIRGIAMAENVRHREFLTITMDRVYSTQRPPLEINLTFPSKPLPGSTLELALYYAATEDEPVMDGNPDIIRTLTLTEADIADGLTLTFEGVEDLPYLFARAYVDIDKDNTLSYGDIAMFYGGVSINDILKNRVLPENIGPRASVDMAMSVWYADEDGALIDIDGNEYATIVIGGLEWMTENLKVTHYRNGAPIIRGQSNAEWTGTAAGMYAVYPHEGTTGPFAVSSDEEMIDRYGLLYNGNAVANPQGLAPAGWRVATDEDYKVLERLAGIPEELIDNTGQRGNISAKLRHADWDSGTDNFGFSALPAGYRNGTGNFNGLGVSNGGRFWSDTNVSGSGNLYSRTILSSNNSVNRSVFARVWGQSVRCVRDKPTP